MKRIRLARTTEKFQRTAYQEVFLVSSDLFIHSFGNVLRSCLLDCSSTDGSDRELEQPLHCGIQRRMGGEGKIDSPFSFGIQFCGFFFFFAGKLCLHRDWLL